MKQPEKLVAILALALWAISFVVPATHQSFTTINGFQLFILGFKIPWGEMESLHIAKSVPLALSWLTNIVFLSRVIKPFRGGESAQGVRFALVFLCGILNIAIAMIYANSVNLRMGAFTHIFEHPGFYLWVASFFVLNAIYDLSRLVGRNAVSERGPSA